MRLKRQFLVAISPESSPLCLERDREGEIDREGEGRLNFARVFHLVLAEIYIFYISRYRNIYILYLRDIEIYMFYISRYQNE
jgi:hypothetical protein